MRKYVCPALVLAVFGLASLPVRAENYVIDDNHSSVSFKIDHLGLSWIHGRFNAVSGNFTIDKNDPSKSAFELTLKAESIDTNNKKRDAHLRSPDFFNVKQFPTITFKSTMVKTAEGGFEVTGDLTMHGETKPITFTLKGGKEAEFPKGVQRTGYSTELALKRSDFGINK